MQEPEINIIPPPLFFDKYWVAQYIAKEPKPYTLVYYVNSENPDDYGVVVYHGKKYNPEAKTKTYTRFYPKFEKLPQKYLSKAKKLKKVLEEQI